MKKVLSSKNKKIWLAVLPLIFTSIAVPLVVQSSFDTGINQASAASKKIEVYRTHANRLRAVSGTSYKECVVNGRNTLYFTNADNYTEKGGDGKYTHYATVYDGCHIWKANLESTLGPATYALTTVRLTYTAVTSDAYIECLTSFEQEPDTSLTPEIADLSYTIPTATTCTVAGNYFTLIAHGDLLLTAINIGYDCEEPTSKYEEVITCNGGNIEVGGTLTLNPTSSFGSSVTFSYRSSHPNIATVSDAGVVTGASLGDAVITVTSSLGNSKNVNISVAGQVYAELLDDNRVYSGGKSNVYPGSTNNSLTAIRKTNSVYNHVYLKFDASDILESYANLAPSQRSGAKIHLRLYAYDSLSTFVPEDILTITARGYNPSVLAASTSDSEHGSCDMLDWDPNYVTWDNVKAASNVQGYVNLDRNSGVEIPSDASSSLNINDKIVDLYFTYSNFASYIYQGEGDYYGYVTISVDYVTADKNHATFTIFTSKNANRKPALSLVAPSEPAPTFDEADVFIYMGQSNMAGRGEAVDSLPCLYHGYEYLSVTGSGNNYIVDLAEPFGVLENNDAMTDGKNGDGSKTGGVVSSFAEGYYSVTGVPIIGVSASVGGTSITKWQRNTTYLAESTRRLMNCIDYIYDHADFSVRHINMVWCQGESDAGQYASGSLDYFGKLQGIIDEMQGLGAKYAIEKCYLIPLSIYSNGAVNANKLKLANDQIAYCDNHPEDFALASKKFYNVPNVMRDDPHFHQGIYNVTGYDAGIHVGQMIENMTVSPYEEFIAGEEITLAAQYGITLRYHT